jgi:hypothetical protein
MPSQNEAASILDAIGVNLDSDGDSSSFEVIEKNVGPDYNPDAYKEEEECVVDLVTDEEAGPTDDEVRDSSNSPLFLFPGPTFADAYKVAEEDIVDLVTDEEATDVEVLNSLNSDTVFFFWTNFHLFCAMYKLWQPLANEFHACTRG